MRCRSFYVKNGDYYELETNYFCDNCDAEMNHLWEKYFVDSRDEVYCGKCAFKLGIIDEETFVEENCYWAGRPKDVGAYIDEDGEVVIWDKRHKDPRTKKNKDYRHNKQYQEWRTGVFARDNFTCAICGQVGGELNAHHIKPFKDYKKERYNVDNGITLCVKCHRRVHREKNKKYLYTGESKMSEQGWFKIYRSVFDNWLWTDKPFSKGCAWIDLIGLANHADNDYMFRGKLIKGKRGEVNRSLHFLSNRWGWSMGKTKRFISVLETEQMVSMKQNSNETVITIENYDKYQPPVTDDKTTSEQQTEHKQNEDRTITEQSRNTNKNVKNVKNVKNNNIKTFVPPTLEEVQEYILEKHYHFDSETFMAFYESNGWKVGRNPMKSWKAACVTWERRNNDDRRNAQYSRSGKTKHGLHTGTEYGADGREDIEAQRLRERTAKLEAAFARPNTLLDGDI